MPSLAQRLAFLGVLAFVLVLPIENVLVLPRLGSLSATMGLFMMVLAIPAFLVRGGFSIRRQPAVTVVLVLYVLWSIAGLLWSLEPDRTIVYVTTFVQLTAFVVITWQVCRVDAQRHALQRAYLIGCTLAVLDAVRNFLSGNEAVFLRFAVSNTDPNEYALALVIGIPMAWDLFASGRRWWRAIYLLFVPVALVAIVLSSSRGAALAAAFAMLVFPLGFAALDRGGKRALVVATLVAIAAVPFAWADLEPLVSKNVQRLGTLGSELTSGTLNERSVIWGYGMAAFAKRPLLGVGGGAFAAAIENESGLRQQAHNSFVSVAVELGTVGFLLFLTILALAALPLVRAYGPRTMPSLIMLLTLVVGIMSLTWEFRKPMWLVIALLLAVRSVDVVRALPASGAEVQPTLNFPDAHE